MHDTDPSGHLTSYRRSGLVFEVADRGPRDGEVVVLLHGFPQLNTCWEAVATLLNDSGLRTLAPNQRGYSPGARPSGRRAYAMSELVGDVTALVEEVGGPVHLVGHDWGAAVAWATAVVRPDLLRTLTTVSVPHPGAFLATMPRGQALHSWYMALFNVPGVPERVLGNRALAEQAMRRGGMSPELFDRFWMEFGPPPGARTSPALRGGLAWYRALALGDRSLFDRHVAVPTTHVWSTGDGFLVRAGAELTGKYVDADYRLEVLEGVSHWIPDERPDELASLIAQRAASAR